jgi:DNA-binding response OmpR family regulator
MGKTVLCISDDRAAILLYQSLLELDGYFVLVAETNDEGLGICEGAIIDCIVVDHKTEGVVLVKQIARRWSSPAMIFVTDRSEVIEWIYSQVDMFISKEEAIEQLVQLIQEVLRRRGDTGQNDPNLLTPDDNYSFLHPSFLRWLLP